MAETQEIKQPSPFSDGAWATVPPTQQEPIVEEKTEPTVTDEVKDPVIEKKDEEIKEEKPTSDKPDDPLKIPAATPPPVQDLPEEKKEVPEASKALIPEELEDEIFDRLSKRHTLKNLDKLSPTEVIKLHLRNQHQDYTSQDIDDLFSERFYFPEKPEQGLAETDDEFKLREDKYNEQLLAAQRRIERESKTSKKELQQQLQELVLPDIPQKTPEPQQPTQEDLARQKEQRDNFLQAVDGGLKELNGYNATFKDKEVEIPIAYAVTDEEKQKIRPLLDSLDTDLPQFFHQLNWLDKDGKLNANKVVSDLHIILNKDEVIQKFVNEAGNKRNAEAIKRQKNVDFSSQQRRGKLEPSVQEEVDKKVRGFFAAS